MLTKKTGRGLLALRYENGTHSEMQAQEHSSWKE